jgi:hypothetical protein
MRASSLVLFALSFVTAGPGCTCSTPTRRDAGGADDVRMIPDDVPRPDAPTPDFGDTPPFDAPCMVTTPVMSEIIGDPPDILIAMDISGSMCSPLFPSPLTGMEIMKTALISLVTDWDARVNWGLLQFPSDNACGAGTVVNPIMPRNAANIVTRLNMLMTGTFACAFMNMGATPTHTSIDAARTYFESIPVSPIGRYVLLATDGLPNCGAMLPDGSTEETVDETVAAIDALRGIGVNTYVLGFGATLTGGSPALMRMATAGGTTRPYSARTPMELELALDAIAAEVTPASCTIALDGPVRDPSLFQVRFAGGDLIPRDPSHTRGWDYDAATNTITFYGAECAAVMSGAVTDIDVDFGCPGPVF